ncbi:helix-turn-helix domain-containing protein [Methylicorpusculum oleiharenae]|uniref:helix-turn-helix domain-containing protein n=1 Tax=Methylicorpusculum oleiharenae TaxID=1338687 RepID=UPI0013583BC6|nr:helix-turn-helix domain-containing protein [Methylicorpusculum oleiharenae]MCD2449726.1 helix-turn-helix domain-containing protein [Methylicorpusculum oleiharenae]
MSSLTLQDIASRLDILTTAVLSNKSALTIEEASAYMGLSLSQIYKLTSTQAIPHYKPRGKMLYFDRNELDSWLLQRRVKTVSEIEEAAINHVNGLRA